MLHRVLCFICCLSLLNLSAQKTSNNITLVILGTVQDAGSPHIACKKECCSLLFEKEDATRKVVSLGILDHGAQKTFLFEATPDITSQLYQLQKLTGWAKTHIPNGVFLTHAHIGHYTGLMYLGKEAVNSKNTPVYAMPKMESFLTNNGPWSQLITNKNILIKPLKNQTEVILSEHLKVIPFTVPHRDEYSETVGYKIIGPNKTALFIPDIDKWIKWETDISTEIKKVDYAFLDATFFNAEEINNRAISEIPHPFVIESMSKFNTLSDNDKKKVYFIHFNHTNPLLNTQSQETKLVIEKGYSVTRQGMQIEL